MQSFSLKKLGKRPELHEVDLLDMARTTPLPQSPGVNPAQQKRVLPSRSRRGGPGIGNCSVDMLIIDTERRTREAKPVIPPNQEFFLTTHSKSVPPPPEASTSDGEAVGSYFDKPEVKAAYLAQRAIQVPEFSPLPDDAVGGRLRARAEEEGPETLDATYINRHRKYETFEKRQRRREKEKLVHEQYKLKERIEQLKGMDSSAFGGGGETRRKEMLDVAEGLEMRYAVLLPPEPKRMKKAENKRKSDGARAGTTTGDDADVETEDEVVEHPMQEVQAPPSVPIGPRPYQVNKSNVRLSLQPPGIPKPPPPHRTPAVSVALAASSPSPAQYTYIVPTASTSPNSRSNHRIRDSTGRFILQAKSETSLTPAVNRSTPESPAAAPDVVSAPPPRKRPRTDSQPKRMQTPEAKPFTTSLLLQIAARKAAQPLARQTSRTVLAFGFKVPPEVEEQAHYELPEWLITQGELEHLHEQRARSTTRSASPNPVDPLPNGVRTQKEAAAPPTTSETPTTLINGTTDSMVVDESQGPASLKRDNIEKDLEGSTVLQPSTLPNNHEKDLEGDIVMQPST